MKSIRNENTNTTYVRHDCNDLPGAAYKYEDETPAIETCWELTDEELEILKKTKKVYVQQEGKTLPPMMLSVESVFGDSNDTK